MRSERTRRVLRANDLLPELSRIIAECTEKPEQYVMAMIDSCKMMMSGQQGNCAFATIKGIGGLSLEVNENVSCKLAELIEGSLGIPKNRIYLNFVEIERKDWGYNGKTFA